MNYQEMTLLLKSITNNRIRCKCGHSVLFNTDRIICNHCGNYIHKNKLLEFKYILKKEMRKTNERNR